MHYKYVMKCSNDLYFKIDNILNKGLIDMPLSNKTRWIHLRDAVGCGSISSMEAYDCIKLGYVAEHLLIRKSNYSHLI